MHGHSLWICMLSAVHVFMSYITRVLPSFFSGEHCVRVCCVLPSYKLEHLSLSAVCEYVLYSVFVCMWIVRCCRANSTAKASKAKHRMLFGICEYTHSHNECLFYLYCVRLYVLKAVSARIIGYVPLYIYMDACLVVLAQPVPPTHAHNHLHL